MNAISYILCSAPRSGTTLLCDMLKQTGVAGRPNSFLRQDDLAKWASDWGVAPLADPADTDFGTAYFDAMRREGQGGTAVFGLRLMGGDLGFACDWLKRLYPDHGDDLSRMKAAFGPDLRFVHLHREDKLAEAVSLLRAEQTGLWHGRADGTAYETLTPVGKEGYNADAITARVEILTHAAAVWPRWFARQGIAPLSLTYEELARDPQATLADVLAHVGQDRSIAHGIRPGLRRLSGATNAEWIARYRSERGANRA